MSILGDGKSIVDLLARGLTWIQDRRDPVRAQAQRMIDAFEAHGIARQQIARVLPPELSITPAALSSADELKDKVTPALLDWAADYLALDRRWLDRIDARPHQRVDGYKNDGVYAGWLRQRLVAAPAVDCVLELDRFPEERLIRSQRCADGHDVYTLIQANRAELPMQAMCKTLRVSTSGHCARSDRAPSAGAAAKASGLHQRIAHLQRRKAAKVAVCGPQLANAVVDGQRGDAGVVHHRPGDAR